MKLDYKRLSNEILEISREAGEEILKIYDKTDIGITYKGDNSPLTLADKASNDIIEKRLKELTPSIPVNPFNTPALALAYKPFTSLLSHSSKGVDT